MSYLPATQVDGQRTVSGVLQYLVAGSWVPATSVLSVRWGTPTQESISTYKTVSGVPYRWTAGAWVASPEDTPTQVGGFLRDALA